MIYAILFTLAVFLNLALALAFGMAGAIGLGFIACGLAFVAFIASLFCAKLYA